MIEVTNKVYAVAIQDCSEGHDVKDGCLVNAFGTLNEVVHWVFMVCQEGVDEAEVDKLNDLIVDKVFNSNVPSGDQLVFTIDIDRANVVVTIRGY